MVEWIEIAMTYYVAVLEAVSTLVVEWIEIQEQSMINYLLTSPPSWWSGLKFKE